MYPTPSKSCPNVSLFLSGQSGPRQRFIAWLQGQETVRQGQRNQILEAVFLVVQLEELLLEGLLSLHF